MLLGSSTKTSQLTTKNLFNTIFTVMNYYLRLFKRYIKQNKLTSLFWGYVMFSILLKVVSDIDITIPCPIRLISGVHCLGCGLTTATIYMLKFNFVAAWYANPFAFIVDPLILFFMIRHFYKFLQTEKGRAMNTLNDNFEQPA